MSLLIRFTPTSLSAEQYDGIVRRLEEEGDFPPDGLELHVCFGDEPNLRVSEVWDSQEQLDAFSERLQPLLDDAGLEPANEPEVLAVHNVIKR